MRCIECGNDVVLEDSYSPLLITHGTGAFRQVAFEQRDRVCEVCGLVHNFDVRELNRHTLADVIEALRAQEWFSELAYEDKAWLLYKIRQAWNEHYRSLNRLASPCELLEQLLGMMGICVEMV